MKKTIIFLLLVNVSASINASLAQTSCKERLENCKAAYLDIWNGNTSTLASNTFATYLYKLATNCPNESEIFAKFRKSIESGQTKPSDYGKMTPPSSSNNIDFDARKKREDDFFKSQNLGNKGDVSNNNTNNSNQNYSNSQIFDNKTNSNQSQNGNHFGNNSNGDSQNMSNVPSNQKDYEQNFGSTSKAIDLAESKGINVTEFNSEYNRLLAAVQKGDISTSAANAGITNLERKIKSSMTNLDQNQNNNNKTNSDYANGNTFVKKFIDLGTC